MIISKLKKFSDSLYCQYFQGRGWKLELVEGPGNAKHMLARCNVERSVQLHFALTFVSVFPETSLSEIRNLSVN